MSILIRLSKPLIFIVAIGLLALLWQISGNGLKAPSYLFGTMHIISNENYFFGENAKKESKIGKKCSIRNGFK